jgi:hypothetical protein
MQHEMAGWLTEEQVIDATGVGRFTLDRWRRAGLISWDRRFLGFGTEKGSPTVYPPIAVEQVRHVQKSSQECKGYERWGWESWRAGLPVPGMIGWIVKRLDQLEERAVKSAGTGKIKTVIADIAEKGRLRRKPHQPIFSKVRDPNARKAILEWSLAIGAGSVPSASIYDHTSPAAKAFHRAAGSGETPDPLHDIENLSFTRLRELASGASAGELEKARLDCSRLADIVALAASLDWRRIRDVIGVTHQGGPEVPIAPYERLSGLWDNLNFRACLVPFLIFMRRQPGYRYELDERFASMEIELHALADKAAAASLPA